MLVSELFEQDDMTERLRQAALDYLTPLMSQNVPFVTVQQVIDALRHGQFGLVINRQIVMDLLNPEQVRAIDKIEGDRIYLQAPEDKTSALDQDDKQKNQDHVKDMAVDQVKAALDKPALGGGGS